MILCKSSTNVYYNTANCSLSLTVSESIIETYIAQDNVLNTGFQQARNPGNWKQEKYFKNILI